MKKHVFLVLTVIAASAFSAYAEGEAEKLKMKPPYLVQAGGLTLAIIPNTGGDMSIDSTGGAIPSSDNRSIVFKGDVKIHLTAPSGKVVTITGDDLTLVSQEAKP